MGNSGGVYFGPDGRRHENGLAPSTHTALSGPSLADQIATLEVRHIAVSMLCGEILATLRVNHQRGTLATAVADKNAFAGLLESWDRMLTEASNRKANKGDAV